MAAKRSDKSRWPSRFCSAAGTPKFLGPGAYLAEVMVERIARKESAELPLEYWKQKKWSNHFRHQVVLANKLLKQFSAAALSKAIRTPEGKRAYSLGAPFLRELAQAAQERLDMEKLPVADGCAEFFVSVPSSRSPYLPRTSALARLRFS